MATSPALPDSLLVMDNDVFTDWRKHRQGTRLYIKNYRKQIKLFPKLTAITVLEARLGFEIQIAKLGGLDQENEQRRAEMEGLIQLCGVLEFEQSAAGIAAHIFARLSKSKRNQHWRDVLIAATALAKGHGVATRNQTDFELIGQHLPPYAPTLYLAIWKP